MRQPEPRPSTSKQKRSPLCNIAEPLKDGSQQQEPKAPQSLKRAPLQQVYADDDDVDMDYNDEIISQQPVYRVRQFCL